MFYLDCTFEDSRIVATEVEQNRDTMPFDSDWPMNVSFIDTHSGKVYRKTLGLVDLGKLLAYACSGNDGDDLDSIAYDYCNHLLTDCPPECRPIP